MTWLHELAGSYSNVFLSAIMLLAGLIIGLIIGAAYGYYRKDEQAGMVELDSPERQARTSKAVESIPPRGPWIHPGRPSV